MHIYIYIYINIYTYTIYNIYNIYIYIIRAVKMDYNPRANPTHHGFGPGWIEKKLQISIWVKNEPKPINFKY